MALEDDDLWLVDVIATAGHLACGGWQYDAHTGRLVCACTARLFKAAMVEAT